MMSLLVGAGVLLPGHAPARGLAIDIHCCHCSHPGMGRTVCRQQGVVGWSEAPKLRNQLWTAELRGWLQAPTQGRRPPVLPRPGSQLWQPQLTAQWQAAARLLSHPLHREEEEAVVPQLKVGGRKGSQPLLCHLSIEMLPVPLSLSSAQASWKKRGEPAGDAMLAGTNAHRQGVASTSVQAP